MSQYRPSYIDPAYKVGVHVILKMNSIQHPRGKKYAVGIRTFNTIARY